MVVFGRDQDIVVTAPTAQAAHQSAARVYMFHWWRLMTPDNAIPPVTLKVTVRRAGVTVRDGPG